MYWDAVVCHHRVIKYVAQLIYIFNYFIIVNYYLLEIT